MTGDPIRLPITAGADAAETAAALIELGATAEMLAALDATFGTVDPILHAAVHLVRYREGCPLCPGCGNMPRIVTFGTQAFCGEDSCQVFMWDPSAADGGMANPGTIDASFFNRFAGGDGAG